MRFLLGREDGSRGGCKSGGDTRQRDNRNRKPVVFLKSRGIQQWQAFPEFSGETKKWYDFEKPPKRIDSSTQGAFEVKGLPGTVR